MTNETKRPGRKPSSATALMNDLKAAMRAVDQIDTVPHGDENRLKYENRQLAWSNVFAQARRQDALILARTFGALAQGPERRRMGLIYLAAVILNEAAKCDNESRP